MRYAKHATEIAGSALTFKSGDAEPQQLTVSHSPHVERVRVS